MAKPKTPNQKQQYQELNRRLQKYILLVQQIYEDLALEASKLVLRTGYDPEGKKVFRFKDYPQTKAGIDKLLRNFVEDMQVLIYQGTSKEWKQSNEIQSLLADKVISSYTGQIDREKYKIYYQTNSDALKAFQQRKDEGMNLSQKLWNQSRELKEELEETISTAIQKGYSAITLSKRVSKYLNDFPTFQKDYKEKYGKASDIHDCEFRSARLAASEINIAYRRAEQMRWEQMDFVVGYEIKPSGMHKKKDICDLLAGKYPKNFKWVGWHPLCKDYCLPIMKTEEEFWAHGYFDDPNDTTSVNEVKDVPDAFKQWVGTNALRIEAAKRKGTSPYFIKDNQEIVNNILSGAPVGDYYTPTGTDIKGKTKWSENAIKIEKKLGVKSGTPMTFEEANELRGNINYHEGKKYQINCQSCVVANELRRRGLDVTAQPNMENGDLPDQLSRKTNWAWIDPETGEMPKKTIIGRTVNGRGSIVAKSMKETLHDLYEATKEPGRYHIDWGWKGKNEGHIVTFERTPDGKAVWYDPQSGKKNFFTKDYYSFIRVSHGIGVLRVDNLLVNTDIINGIVTNLQK